MTTERQTTEPLAKALPGKNLFSFPFLSNGMTHPFRIVFLCLSPEEVARFCLASNGINQEINNINKSIPNYWESQLIKLGIDNQVIQQARVEDPTVDYRKWYGACKVLLAHAPGNACLPMDIYDLRWYAYMLHPSARWLIKDNPYPILERPKFLQLVLSGSYLILQRNSPIPEEADFKEDIFDGYKTKFPDFMKIAMEANILHYAAWSGSYEMLIQALNKYGILMRDPRSVTLLLCAEKSGAVKTNEQRIAVLSACFGDPGQRIFINSLPKYFSFQSGTNLLHDAAQKGSIEILRFFEGKIHASTWLIPSRRGGTALHYAAQGGFTEVIEFLHSLKVGFDPNAQDNYGKTPADWVKKITRNVQEEDEDSLTPEEQELLGYSANPFYGYVIEEQELSPQKQAAVLLALNNMELELQKLQRQINRERAKKTLCSLAVGAIASVGISYALTGTVLLSVCCAGAAGTLLIALLIHSAYHCRISFFKPAEVAELVTPQSLSRTYYGKRVSPWTRI
jgi:hypothetical protein